MKTDYFLNENLTYSKLMEVVTNDYFDKACNNLPPLEIIMEDVLKLSKKAINEYNLGPLNEDSVKDDPINVRYPYQKKGSSRFLMIKEFTNYQVAKIFSVYFKVKQIYFTDETLGDNYRFGFYNEDGPMKGLYDIDDSSIHSKLLSIRNSLSKSDFISIYENLAYVCPKVKLCSDIDLVAVNNGIFNYKTKKLLDFNPDYIFLSKSQVNYREDVKNPQIKMHDGLMWDIEFWLRDLVHCEDDYNLLWQIISATLRHKVKWNKAIFLYATSGNNGKGTFCELLRNLLGPNNHTSIPISAFSKDFLLEPLLNVSNVITDENDTNAYLDAARNFKSAITQDKIYIDIKYKKPICFRFKGLLVECINNVFKVKDKTDSLYRRLLFVKMDKKFQGVERRYIKDDYIKREDVLEYVLFKALTDNSIFKKTKYSDLESVPKEYMFHISEISYQLCLETKESNDPIRQFVSECFYDFVWDFLPYDFLYSCYKNWFLKNISMKSVYVSKKKFIQDIKDIIESDYDDWVESENKVTISKFCNKPEPFIISYDVKDWMNNDYKGTDKNILTIPNFGNRRLLGFMKK